MRIEFNTFPLTKRFALTISRGTSADSTNVWVKIQADGIEGWGEAAGFSWYGIQQESEDLCRSLQSLSLPLQDCHPLERERIHRIMTEQKTLSAARAAVDMALFDWMGRSLSQPVWRLWGLERETVPITSVTVGLNPPEQVKIRVRDWLEVAPGCALKIKLGSPQGVEFDRAVVLAVKEVAPDAVSLRVDANGGWDLDTAMQMSQWLAGQGVDYIEQPLPRGREDELIPLCQHSPLPIFIDESCFDRADIVRFADRVHGINIKLMKCGGMTEALRMIHTAQACGLRVMLGCFSESALAIQAAVQLSPLADTLDLDSHLNMKNHPFVGSPLVQGRIIPTEQPGLGVQQGNKGVP